MLNKIIFIVIIVIVIVNHKSNFHGACHKEHCRMACSYSPWQKWQRNIVQSNDASEESALYRVITWWLQNT